jgi:hypothetical protein
MTHCSTSCTVLFSSPKESLCIGPKRWPWDILDGCRVHCLQINSWTFTIAVSCLLVFPRLAERIHGLHLPFLASWGRPPPASSDAARLRTHRRWRRLFLVLVCLSCHTKSRCPSSGVVPSQQQRVEWNNTVVFYCLSQRSDLQRYCEKAAECSRKNLKQYSTPGSAVRCMLLLVALSVSFTTDIISVVVFFSKPRHLSQWLQIIRMYITRANTRVVLSESI